MNRSNTLRVIKYAVACRQDMHPERARHNPENDPHCTLILNSGNSCVNHYLTNPGIRCGSVLTSRFTVFCFPYVPIALGLRRLLAFSSFPRTAVACGQVPTHKQHHTQSIQDLYLTSLVASFRHRSSRCVVCIQNVHHRI